MNLSPAFHRRSSIAGKVGKLRSGVHRRTRCRSTRAPLRSEKVHQDVGDQWRVAWEAGPSQSDVAVPLLYDDKIEAVCCRLGFEDGLGNFAKELAPLGPHEFLLFDRQKIG